MPGIRRRAALPTHGHPLVLGVTLLALALPAAPLMGQEPPTKENAAQDPPPQEVGPRLPAPKTRGTREIAAQPGTPWAAMAADLGAVIQGEMDMLAIPGMAIAVSVEGETVWARAFGVAAPGRSRPGPALTLEHAWRCGEVTQLVTNWLVGQQVAAGALGTEGGPAGSPAQGLDTPVQDLLPGWWDTDPATPTTLRQLIRRKSDLCHAPPVGHAHDPEPFTLAEVVNSILANPRRLASEWTWFHNHSGHAVLGRILELNTGTPFADLAAERVFGPLGMDSSHIGIDRLPADAPRVMGTVWTPDGREIPTPEHRVSCSPSLGLVSTVPDLLRLGEARLALVDQAGSDEPDSLHQVLRNANRLLGHNGSLAGQTVLLWADWQTETVVVLAANLHWCDAILARLRLRVEQFVKAVAEGTPVPRPRPLRPVGRQMAQRLAGRYGAGGYHADLMVRGDDLFVQLENTIPLRVRATVGAPEQGLFVCDRMLRGARLIGPEWPAAVEDGTATLNVVNRQLPREARPWTDPRRHPRPTGRLRLLIGEYACGGQRVIVREDGGRLWMLVDWVYICGLDPVDPPASYKASAGARAGDPVEFELDLASGAPARSVSIGGVRYERVPMGAREGNVFRIEPLKTPEELRALAAAATPPAQPEGLRDPDLVELKSLDDTIRYDIRYGTPDNFMGFALYDFAGEPRAKLQRPAAEALVRAHRRLKEQGLGLLIHDAYRPWAVTKMFWDATPDRQKEFVANPATGSRHNRGCAVDVSLYVLATGEPVAMPSGYDEFTPRAHAYWPGGTARQRDARRILQQAMNAAGFATLENEWWHFDHRDWQRYPILNEPLE